MNKHVSSMELLTLLHKSDNSQTNLSLADRAVLSVILCHVNGGLIKGYEAWPSTGIIATKTGLSATGIGKCRKSLVAGGWIGIVSGRKEGVANHYFVNASKIIEVALASGATYSGKPVAGAITVPVVGQHDRNIIGLKQGKVTPEIIIPKKPTLAWYDEPTPVVAVIESPVPINADGYKPFHRNGTRCYSQADHESATKRHIDEVNSCDEPF